MAADVIREAIIRLGVELSKDGFDSGELTRSTEAFDKHTKAVNEAVQATEQVEQATSRYNEMAAQASEANLRAAEAAKQAGTGAFTAARGFAFLAASNEESEAAMLRTIATAQGAFDVFQGGVDIVKGLWEANRALAAASTAAASAETAKAAAITASGAAATTATPALAAMGLTLSPIGIGVAGLTAAALAGVTLWNQYGNAGKEAGESIAEGMTEAERAAAKLRQEMELIDAAQRNLDRRTSFGSDDRRLGFIERRLRSFSDDGLAPEAELQNILTFESQPRGGSADVRRRRTREYGDLLQRAQAEVSEAFELRRTQSEIRGRQDDAAVRELEKLIAELRRKVEQDPAFGLGQGGADLSSLEQRRDELLRKQEERVDREEAVLDRLLNALEEIDRRVDRFEQNATIPR